MNTPRTTRLQDEALNMLRRSRFKHLTMIEWTRNTHHNTRQWLLAKGIVRYTMLNEREWFAVLVYDPRDMK
jgi:hypothetical protein